MGERDDEAGAGVYQTQTTALSAGLPATIRLREGVEYSWEVSTRTAEGARAAGADQRGPPIVAIGVVAGICRIIPYFDVIVGGILSTIVLLSNFGGWGQVLSIVLVFLVVQALDGAFVTPAVIGDRVCCDDRQRHHRRGL